MRNRAYEDVHYECEIFQLRGLRAELDLRCCRCRSIYIGCLSRAYELLLVRKWKAVMLVGSCRA